MDLSLALNYAMGGENVWGYHAINLLTHVLAGLVLFGIVRRTLQQPALAVRFGASALPLGAAVAAIWLLHPIQTEAVTYIVQRAESLMALGYLLTLYTFIRSTTSDRPIGWLVASVAACLLGMISKEVMVSAPVMVLLYDRTFVAGSFVDAWRRRRSYYLALAATWLPLAALVAGTAGRGGTVGFDTMIGPWAYLLTQCQAIIHYLRLAVWPDALVFDYGTGTVSGLGDVWWQALLLVGLAAGTLWALVRRPVWGLVGAWFFLILAPSSSIVPIASQTMAEHRMYLPLVALVVSAVLGLYVWLGRRSLMVWGVLAVALAGRTIARNADYRSEEQLWADTVAKWPSNGRAHNNLGKALVNAGRPSDAVAHYEEAIRLQPTAPEPHYNLGLALAKLGRPAEAAARYEEALHLQPDYAEAHNNLGNLLLNAGRLEEAATHYDKAARLKPDFAEAHSNLSNVRLEQGQPAEAIRHGEEAVRLDPDYAEARYNLGNALAASRQLAAALVQYDRALQLKPGYADVANNRGNVLVELGRLPEAIAAYENAVRLDPTNADPRRNLTVLFTQQGRFADALVQLRAYIALRPEDGDARAELVRLQGLVRQ